MNNKYKVLNIGEIGKSTLEEEIFYIKIGNGKKKIFINAAHHANEWMTSLVIMIFIENYSKWYEEKNIYKGYSIRELYDNVSIYIVPMVNPDGVNLVLGKKNVLDKQEYKKIWFNYKENLYIWKANIRGVDLNLNYPAGWEKAVINKKKLGIVNPGPRDYAGKMFLSEIETINMYEFTKKYKFDMSISLHSQGREIYWSYLENKNPIAYNIGKKFEEVSGYILTEPDYFSSFGGYKDWFIDEFDKPGYTIEIGKGKAGEPLPLEYAYDIYKEIEEILLVAIDETARI